MSHQKPRKPRVRRKRAGAGKPGTSGLPQATTADQIAAMESEGQAQQPGTAGTTPDQDSHVGATEKEVADRTGPGAGYDTEPVKKDDPGGVA
jgi:hypothetical protein